MTTPFATESGVPLVAEDELRIAAPSGVMRGGAIALASRAIGLAASLATGIVTARALGPDGKGTLAFLSAVAAILVRFGSLGMDGTFAHYYLTRRRQPADCVGVVVWLSLGAGAAAAAVAIAALGVFPGSMPLVPLRLGLPFFASAPAFFILFVVTFVLFAQGRETFFGVFDIAYRLTMLASLFLALNVLGGGLTASVWVQIAVSVGFASIAIVSIARSVGWRLPLRRALAREMLASGSRYYAYGLLRYVLCYQAILVAGVTLTDRDTGLLSVAVMLGETLLLFAGSVNLAFYPAVSTSANPRRYTATVAGRLAVMTGLLALLLALAARPLVSVLYGSAFLPSVSAFFLMAPGYVLLSAEQVTASYFAARGMPWWVDGVLLGGIVLAMILMPPLAHRFGLNGVAAGIGIAQAVAALVVVVRFAQGRD